MMKVLAHIVALGIILSLVHCASQTKLQDNAPTEIEEVYFQRWNSGIEGGNSGANFYIKTAQIVSLDSLYWRDSKIKLNVNPNNPHIHLGSFIISNNVVKLEDKISKMPFQLKKEEFVVSYLQNGKKYYVKMRNIAERKPINYPIYHPIKQ